MMDHFKEDIVSPRAKALSNVLYVLCWVFIVLFGGYALMMLQVVMLQFSVTALVTVLMAAAFAVLLFFLKDNLKVEYEYTFTNGSLDFAKVFRQAKRKELGSMNVKNVSACGHVAGDSFRRYLAMKDVENGSILLYHANAKDVRCLRQLIPALLENYECVTVSELLHLTPPVYTSVFAVDGNS